MLRAIEPDPEHIQTLKGTLPVRTGAMTCAPGVSGKKEADQNEGRRTSAAFSLTRLSSWGITEYHRQGQVGQDAGVTDRALRNSPERQVRKLTKGALIKM